MGFLFRDEKENIGIKVDMAPGMIWGQHLPGLVQPIVSQATSSDVPLRLTGSNITAYTGREKEKRDTKTEREATIMG